MTHISEFIPIGTFRRPHALKGEISAVVDNIEFLDPGSAFFIDIDGIYVPFFIEGIRVKGTEAVLVKIDNINTEKDARIFVNKEIYIERDRFNHLTHTIDDVSSEGGYASDFIGYRIEDSESNMIGIIEDIDISTQNALFIVRSGEKQILIPIADEFVIGIDEEEKVIKLSLPSGLLSL